MLLNNIKNKHKMMCEWKFRTILSLYARIQFCCVGKFSNDREWFFFVHFLRRNSAKISIYSSANLHNNFYVCIFMFCIFMIIKCEFYNRKRSQNFTIFLISKTK